MANGALDESSRTAHTAEIVDDDGQKSQSQLPGKDAACIA